VFFLTFEEGVGKNRALKVTGEQAFNQAGSANLGWFKIRELGPLGK